MLTSKRPLSSLNGMPINILVLLFCIFSFVLARAQQAVPSKVQNAPVPAKPSKKPAKFLGADATTKANSIVKNDEFCRHCLSFGTGLNYFVFQQRPPVNVEPVDYRNLGYPNIHLRSEGVLNPQWGYLAEIQSVPGGSLNSSSLKLENPTVAWNFLDLNAKLRMNKNFHAFGLHCIPSYIFSLQAHSVPFVSASTSTYEVSQLTMETVGVGFYMDILSQGPFRYFWTNRIQFPIAHSSVADVKYGFSFDGTIGAIYPINSKYYTNLVWSGQYHRLSYSINQDSGTYTLVNSSLLLSVGYIL